MLLMVSIRLSSWLSQVVWLLEQVTGDDDITEVTGDDDITEVVETTSIRMIAVNISVVLNLLISTDLSYTVAVFKYVKDKK